jgi:DNA ligase-1
MTMFKPASCLLLLGLPFVLQAAPALHHSPMLATAISADQPGPDDLENWLVSEKYDGVRAYWDGRQLYSRSGYPINPPAEVTRGWPDVPLEGELWSGYGRYSEVSGLINRHQTTPDEWRDIRFMLFDLPHWPGTFSQRASRLEALVNTAGVANLVPVQQHVGLDAAGLQRLLDSTLERGGEGLMLHRGSALYQFSRSTDLRKLKRHQDAEATVVAHLPGKGKYEGMLGALLVELEDGRRFRLGTGFSDAERTDPPALGSLVSFRYDGLTTHGLPRFARFLRVRTPE